MDEALNVGLEGVGRDGNWPKPDTVQNRHRGCSAQGSSLLRRKLNAQQIADEIEPIFMFMLEGEHNWPGDLRDEFVEVHDVDDLSIGMEGVFQS